MVYKVRRSNPSLPPINVNENSTNTVNTSLSLVGENYKNYGRFINQNFVHLVENFANSSPPKNPLRGQLWYDTSRQALLMYVPEQAPVVWQPIAGVTATVSADALSQLIGASEGSMLYTEGSAETVLAAGSEGQLLQIVSGYPVWTSVESSPFQINDSDLDTRITVANNESSDNDQIRGFTRNTERFRIDPAGSITFFSDSGAQKAVISSASTQILNETQIRFNASREMISLSDTKANGAGATPFIAFRDNANTRLSVIGQTLPSSNDLILKSDVSNIRLQPGGGKAIIEGNVGVAGRANPDSQIHFSNSTVDSTINRLLLFGNSKSDLNTGYGFGIESGTLTYHTAQRHSFRYRGTEIFQVNANGTITNGHQVTGDLIVTDTDPSIIFNDTTGGDWKLEGNGSEFYLRTYDYPSRTNGPVKFQINTAGDVKVFGKLTTTGTIISHAAETLIRNTNSSYTGISGGNDLNNGGNLLLYGPSHSSAAGRVAFRNGTDYHALFDGDRIRLRVNNTDKLRLYNNRVESTVDIKFDDGRGLTTVKGSYGTVQTVGPGKGGWEGYSIDGHAVFMGNSSGDEFGLYNDANNRWAFKYDGGGGWTGLQAPSGDWGLISRNNAETELFYNGNLRLETQSDGVRINGNIDGPSNFIVGNGQGEQIYFYQNDNSTIFYASGQQVMRIYNNRGYLKPNGTNRVYWDDNEFRPINDGYMYLGTNSHRWRHGYFDNITVTNGIPSAVYNGNNSSNTNYPIGTYVLVPNNRTNWRNNTSNMPDLNQSVVVRRQDRSHFSVVSGTPLSGTWKYRGGSSWSDGDNIFQRIL